MIDAGELDGGFLGGFVIWESAGNALDGDVQIEQKRTPLVGTDHALDPKKRAQPSSAGDGRDVMEAGGWVKDEVAGGELDVFRSVSVFDDEFTAIVFLR